MSRTRQMKTTASIRSPFVNQVAAGCGSAEPECEPAVARMAGGVAPARFFSECKAFVECLPDAKADKSQAGSSAGAPAMGVDQGSRSDASECSVMDISSGGAKVAMTTSTLIPNHFELAFAQGGQTRSCEVIWRHGKILGSNLLSETTPSQRWR